MAHARRSKSPNGKLRFMYHVRRSLIFAAVICGLLNCQGVEAEAQTSNVVRLENGWQIQSEAALSTDKDKTDGATISSGRFAASGWYLASVPTTVLGALVNDDTY